MGKIWRVTSNIDTRQLGSMYDLDILCRHETPVPILLLGYPNLRQRSFESLKVAHPFQQL